MKYSPSEIISPDFSLRAYPWVPRAMLPCWGGRGWLWAVGLGLHLSVLPRLQALHKPARLKLAPVIFFPGSDDHTKGYRGQPSTASLALFWVGGRERGC